MGDEKIAKSLVGSVKKYGVADIGRIREEPIKGDGLLTEEEFDGVMKGKTLEDLEIEKEQYKENLKEAYLNILDVINEYIDIDGDYPNLLSLWIIGTYFHNNFPSYPFLFFNAMKGSGKTRLLRIIECLSKDGEMLSSLTEAVLFRTRGTLCIDEFEGIQRKGNENLRELLNTCYKKGGKVKRMKQVKTPEGVQQVPEEFVVYRPVAMANIWGMESVLGDRCIQLTLEKSSEQKKINLLEIFATSEIVKKTKEMLNQCSLCRCSFSLETYKEWNSFIKSNYTIYTNYTNNTNNTNYTELFKTIKSMDLNGRELELSYPLCLIASDISDEVLKKTTLTLKSLFQARKEEEFNENTDISLYDFVSQQPEDRGFISVNVVTNEFREFLQSEDAWINSKWMGRALRRLLLVKEKRRVARGNYVILDVKKAQEKIKIFK